MTIPLTQGKWAIIDDNDFCLVRNYKWHAHKSYNVFYAETNIPRPLKGRIRTLKMHRLILGISDSKIQIDHKNGNGLDNTRSNIRIATPSQNGSNRDRQINNKSGRKGVCISKNGQYQAHIRQNGKQKHLGFFDTLEQASSARNKAELEMFGEYSSVSLASA